MCNVENYVIAEIKVWPLTSIIKSSVKRQPVHIVTFFGRIGKLKTKNELMTKIQK